MIVVVLFKDEEPDTADYGRCLVRGILRIWQFILITEKSAIGRADVVVKLHDAIYVFEFKVDGTPEEALEQINSKGYAIPYQPDHRSVVKIGVNFDSTTRTIGDWVIAEE